MADVNGNAILTTKSDECDEFCKKRENISHPEHYNYNGYECIDIIRAVLGDEGFSAFCLGNAIKYLWRNKHKNGVEDLKKTQVYIDWLIQSDLKIKDKEKDEGFY